MCLRGVVGKRVEKTGQCWDSGAMEGIERLGELSLERCGETVRERNVVWKIP